MLIIMKNLLEGRCYHYSMTAVTWERSEIRRYLNSTFLFSFNEADRRRIIETTLVNNNNPWDFTDWYSDSFDFRTGHRVINFYGHANTPGGSNTDDRIFLLSINELLRYFGDSGWITKGEVIGFNDRLEASTNHPNFGINQGRSIYDQYSESRTSRFGRQSINYTAQWDWWLRSPGGRPDFAAFVDTIGGINLLGFAVNRPGGNRPGIRPALWLDMTP